MTDTGAVGPTSVSSESSVHGTPKITLGLMAISVSVFVTLMLEGHSLLQPAREQLLRWGGNYGPLSLGEQPWRLFTSLFVHVSWFHLFLDMLVLYILGRTAERVYGKNTFLLLYLGCGIAGGLFGLWLRPEVVTTGASGAIFGIAGCLAPSSWPTQWPANDARSDLELRSRWKLIYASLLALNFSFVGGNATASVTAIGGMIIGLILGFLLRPHLDSGKKSSRSLVFLWTLVVLIAASQFVRLASAPVLRRERGISAYVAGDFDTAVRELEAAVQKRPTDAYAQAVLGEAYLHKFEYGKAEAPLKQAIAISPHYTYAHEALSYQQSVNDGLNSYDSSDYEAATSSLEIATQIRPDDAYAQYLLGSTYLQLDEYEKAEGSLKKALSLSPKYNEATEALAYVYAVTDRDEDALKEYSSLVRGDPDNESASLGMGTALDNLERYDEAITVFKEAVRRHPDSAEARYSLGFAYADAKEYDNAVASLREALRLEPDYPEARKELSEVLRFRK